MGYRRRRMTSKTSTGGTLESSSCQVPSGFAICNIGISIYVYFIHTYPLASHRSNACMHPQIPRTRPPRRVGSRGMRVAMWSDHKAARISPQPPAPRTHPGEPLPLHACTLAPDVAAVLSARRRRPPTASHQGAAATHASRRHHPALTARWPPQPPPQHFPPASVTAIVQRPRTRRRQVAWGPDDTAASPTQAPPHLLRVRAAADAHIHTHVQHQRTERILC